ncbi:hypothetical protein [Desulfobulbus sp.]|uniref:hypothetical protein n=1 Tax=Desulfobulbus sp. TaxID=895 RepID=UPI00286F1E07|nr:hypothetical protein [Desulfobulbus sp.]
MRFRIVKESDGEVYLIVVSGEVDEDSGWDLLQVAQTMMLMPHCRELVIDLRGARIEDDLSTFSTDTLVSVFEENLLDKDSALVIRFGDNDEIRLCSDQLPLEPMQPYVNVRLDEAKMYGRAMQWLEQEARLLVN